ncbi:MAG: glycosyltransferase family 2 protein, partial [Clostridiales bacterium]|nr:glycosyltransferase family 2 protein [Clostridiales bacterium]
MIKISLCMIVKDEEAVLSRCLESAKTVADEIVIIDTGSTDKTVEIAKSFTKKVFPYPWRDDFAAARNFAFSKGTGDYLFWLDADDKIPHESLAKLPALKARLEKERPDMLICPYETGSTVFYRERFLRREADFVWQGRVHECIAPRGKVLHSDFLITHLGSAKERGTRNLHIYQKWAAEEPLSGRDLFYYGRELYYNRLYTEAIAVLLKMLDGDGWYVNKIEACKILSLCYREIGDKEKALRALFRSFLYG